MNKLDESFCIIKISTIGIGVRKSDEIILDPQDKGLRGHVLDDHESTTLMIMKLIATLREILSPQVILKDPTTLTILNLNRL